MMNRIVSGITFCLFCGIYFLASVTTIETKEVGVVRTFGIVEDRVLLSGLRFINPWQSLERMHIWQRSYERSSSKGNAAGLIGSDQIRIDADLTFHWILNPEYARLIYLKFGKSYESKIILPPAASAIREGASGFNWVEIVAEKRKEVQEAMTRELKNSVIEKLVANGIEADIAEQMFTFPVVDLRRAVPIAESLLKAVELKKAALQEQERQVTLTAIEDEKAKRRAKEGKGLNNLFRALPRGFNPNNLPQLLQAQALKDIVEKGGDSDIAAYVISNGGSVSPALNIAR